MIQATRLQDVLKDNKLSRKNSLHGKILPIGTRIPDLGFSIIEIPERFPMADNPEDHLLPNDIVEIHEGREDTESPEENLF